MKYKSEFFGVQYEGIGDKIERTEMETATIRTDNNTLIGYFISSNSNRWKGGDMITTYNAGTDYSNDIYASADGSLGFVTAIVGDTVKLKYIPISVSDNSSFTLYKTRIPKFIGRTFGNVTSGSTSITGVTNASVNETFTPGNSIKGFGIPAGAYVTNVSGSTITISLPATSTASNVALYDAKVKATVTNIGIDNNNNSALAYEVPYFVGDQWINVQGGNPFGGYATVSGFTNATGGKPAASFGILQSQSDVNHALINANQIFTGTNQFEKIYVGTDTTEYASTFLRISKSARQQGYMGIQSYGQKGQFGGAADFGLLALNEGGGVVTVNRNSVRSSGVNAVFQVNGPTESVGEMAAFSTNGNYRGGFQAMNNGESVFYSYSDTYNQYAPLNINARVIKLYPKNSSVGGMLIDSSGVYVSNDLKVNNGAVNAASIFSMGGIISAESNAALFAYFAPNGGKMQQTGKATFGDSLRMAQNAGTGTRVGLFRPDGGLVAGGVYKSPDYIPQAVNNGSATNITIVSNASYVGTNVFVDPSAPFASKVFTLPSGVEDNTYVKFNFGGILQGGEIVVTALSILPSSGTNLIQTSSPTTAVSGDCIIYHLYNGHWYRDK